MNIRIEQAVAPVTQVPERTPRRLPRGLADARRLVAQALFRSAEESTASRPPTLLRRGTSCLALAAAALAVPALPSTAFGATPAAGPTVNARHHIPDTVIFPDPSAITFESWAVASWSLSAPDPDPRCFTFPHHHRCAPWMYQPATATRLPSTMADGWPPTIEAVRVFQTSPRVFADADADEPGSPTVPAGNPFTDLPRPAPSTDQTADAGATAPSARMRIISTPMTANTAPATPAAAALKRPHPSPCFRAAYLVGKDRRMLAHLRPAADAISVVVNHPHAACAAMVDYLSRTRA
ncbi:MAG: hypothetical protein JF587_24690 [Catenulisporales bacterium]|nr:hypothetical protein [Catenulisporales bacterium]